MKELKDEIENQTENNQIKIEHLEKTEIDPVEIENFKNKQEANRKNDLEKIIELKDVLNKKLDTAEVKPKDENLEKIQRYHNELKFGAEQRMSMLPQNKMSRLFDVLKGDSQMLKIMKFIGEQNVNNETELNTILQNQKNTKTELEGINKISNFQLENGESSYIVHIDENKWSFSLYGPGVAIGGANMAFVIDGLSKRSDKLIEDHEKYHLNNPKASEWKTVLNANLKKDFIGSGLVVLQSFLKYPKWIRNSLKNLKK